MGQGSSTINNVTVNQTTEVIGASNSVVPSSSSDSSLAPSQSQSIPVSLQIPTKAEELNPSDAATGVASYTNNLREFVQSVAAVNDGSLRHLPETKASLAGNGSNTRAMLDNTTTVRTRVLQELNDETPLVLADKSTSELRGQLSMMDRGETTGVFGGIYNPNATELAAEKPMTIERIMSSGGKGQTSINLMSVKAKRARNILTNLRRVTEILCQPMGSMLLPDRDELGAYYPGISLPVTVNENDVTIGHTGADDTVYHLRIWLTLEKGTAPPTVQLSGDPEPSPVRVVSPLSDLIPNTYYIESLVTNKTDLVINVTTATVINLQFEEAIANAPALTLTIDPARVESMPKNATAFDLFGTIRLGGTSVGPGDITSLWMDATRELGVFKQFIVGHIDYSSAVEAIKRMLGKYYAADTISRHALAESLLLEVDLYPYQEGPIAQLRSQIDSQHVRAIALYVLNLLGPLMVSGVVGPDAALMAHKKALHSVCTTVKGTPMLR